MHGIDLRLLTTQCLGQNLANAESRLIMTKMLYHYEFQLEKDTPTLWPDQKSLGVFMKKPLFVKFSSSQHGSGGVAK